MGYILAYHPLADGRTSVAGKFRRGVAPEDTLYVARLLPNGSLDPSFTPPHFSPGDLPNPSTGAGIVYLYPWYDGNLIVTGRFRNINGQPRNSICMIDTTGNLLAPFHDQAIGSYQLANYTYSEIAQVIEDDEGRLYIAGAYNGYNDGTINDTLQRFVSRLLVEEDLTVAVREEKASAAYFTMHPNPANGTVTFSYEPTGIGDHRITIRDLSGRVIAALPLNSQSSQTWNTTGLAPGTYLVEYVQGEQVLKTEKLVVQR